MRSPFTLLLLTAWTGAAGCARPHAGDGPRAPTPLAGAQVAPPPNAQNPSPMVERTRAHGRVAEFTPRARLVLLEGVLPRPVSLHLPLRPTTAPRSTLLVHFLGAPHIAVDAAHAIDSSIVVAVVNLSPGSSAYERPFREGAGWPSLRRAIDSVLAGAPTAIPPVGDVYLTAFSAGNGAVRAILADSAAAAQVRGVAILDGIHTSYQPARRPLADGGTLDPAPLEAIARFAARAMRGEARLVITHSEVFPGTFASTTETADWLLDRLTLARRAVLAWGPNGMQQTSDAKRARFTLLGFAGNSAPDHLDHLHGLRSWLPLLLDR